MTPSLSMRYVPSPIPIKYDWAFTATANSSGRMQYHKIKPGVSKERISRTEFIHIFNNNTILAVRPLPASASPVFQLEFYV